MDWIPEKTGAVTLLNPLTAAGSAPHRAAREKEHTLMALFLLTVCNRRLRTENGIMCINHTATYCIICKMHLCCVTVRSNLLDCLTSLFSFYLFLVGAKCIGAFPESIQNLDKKSGKHPGEVTTAAGMQGYQAKKTKKQCEVTRKVLHNARVKPTTRGMWSVPCLVKNNKLLEGNQKKFSALLRTRTDLRLHVCLNRHRQELPAAQGRLTSLGGPRSSSRRLTLVWHSSPRSVLSDWCLGNFKNFYCTLLICCSLDNRGRKELGVKGSVHPNEKKG